MKRSLIHDGRTVLLLVRVRDLPRLQGNAHVPCVCGCSEAACASALTCDARGVNIRGPALMGGSVRNVTL